MRMNRTFYHGLSYRKQLLVWFLLIGLIPLLTVGVSGYIRSMRQLQQREQTAMQASLDTAAAILDSQTLLYEDLLSYLANTDIIIEIPLVNDLDSIYEQYETFTYEYDAFLSSLYSQLPEIEQITVYVPYDDVTHGEQFRPISDLESESWYDDGAVTAHPQWYLMDDGTLMVIQRIPEPYTLYIEAFSESFVCIKLDADQFFSVLESVSTDFRLIVQSEQLLYDYQSGSLSSETEAGSGWTEVSASLDNAPWQVTLLRPNDILYAPVRQFLLLTCAVILCTLAGIVLLSRYLSRVFVRRIDLLNGKMNEVRQGNLDVYIHDPCPDEIGTLTNNFQTMLEQINELIRINYQKELETKEANLLALQAQINPHFLYNCLSLINNRAVMSDQPEIAQMARLLSSFYRNMLNHGQSDTTLEKELQTVRSYVEIQQLLHEEHFQAIYQVDETLMTLNIPHLLLQPLAENAILHGILPAKDRPGLVCIGVIRSADAAQFTIMDNGVGIPEEKCKSLTTTQTSGYGLKNVHDRLILTYGEGNGLTIQSAPGEGTLITFSVPLKV